MAAVTGFFKVGIAMNLSDLRILNRLLKKECLFVIKAGCKKKKCRNTFTEQGLLRCPYCIDFRHENEFLLLGYYDLLRRISWIEL